MNKWTQEEAIELCRRVEIAAPAAGCHVALTGGTLYHYGPRKDLDLLFYRIRQVDEINMDRLWALLGLIGIEKKSGLGWCYKAEYQGKKIDCFFPEEPDGEYVSEQGDDVILDEDVPFPA